MTNPQLRQVRTIALEVRRWAQRLDLDALDSNEDLRGLCAIASAELWRRLTKAGFRSARLGYGYQFGGHIFVLLRCHVVDVTASQFGEDSICIVPRAKAACQAWWWKPKKQFRSVRSLAMWQTKRGWPDEQHATRYKQAI